MKRGETVTIYDNWFSIKPRRVEGRAKLVKKLADLHCGEKWIVRFAGDDTDAQRVVLRDAH